MRYETINQQQQQQQPHGSKTAKTEPCVLCVELYGTITPSIGYVDGLPLCSDCVDTIIPVTQNVEGNA